ncbi:MAG TPA: hypothetical protein PL033_08385 [Candidatus Brocadiia bacterium]|nr:hypothetical protein [Candidatus Brocadiia bacterium]
MIEVNSRIMAVMGLASLTLFSGSVRAEDEMVSLVVKRLDESLKSAMSRQVSDPQNPRCGGIADHTGLYHCHTVGGFLKDAAAAYYHPESAYHSDKALFERVRLAAEFLTRSQSPDGNVNLLVTNFNSPPDTGFVVHNVAAAAKLAQMRDDKAVLSLLEPFLRRAGDGMARGGIHTPNHRWVVCAALAQINDVFPDEKYSRRIDQWLAEGIDIDAHGQFTERSTAGYNAIVDNSLVVMAHKLNRPELLDSARRNLDAMAYLLHPDGEVVTEISRRQDLNTRGTMDRYWFALRYLAVRDQNGIYAAMLKPHEPGSVDLARLKEYPELLKPLPEPATIPDDYEKEYPEYNITRIRRGRTSAVILHKGNSRWITMRRGGAVVNAVRFASAFFGKGQFIPSTFEKRDGAFHFRQQLRGSYLQPISDRRFLPVQPDAWAALTLKRKETEICAMNYTGSIRETETGFEIAISAEGTNGVPLAVEINLRGGGEVRGVEPIPGAGDAFLLRDGYTEYRMGDDIIRFGPGQCEHSYIDVRGAEGKLSGPSVYITGYTPFKRILIFAMK